MRFIDYTFQVMILSLNDYLFSPLICNIIITSRPYVGEKLVNFLVEPKKGIKWPPKLPRFSNRHDAIAICKELCKSQYLLRSEKCGKGELEVRMSYTCI
jgi:hypothetical protein